MFIKVNKVVTYHVDPSVFSLLSGRDVPSSVLRINFVEDSYHKSVFRQAADTGQIRMVLKRIGALFTSPFTSHSQFYLILVLVSLANEPGVVPALDGASGELVAASSELKPVSGAFQLFCINSFSQLKSVNFNNY